MTVPITLTARHPAAKITCPVHSHPSPDRSGCICEDGFISSLTSGVAVVCQPCPAGSFCSGNLAYNCTANTVSAPGYPLYCQTVSSSLISSLNSTAALTRLCCAFAAAAAASAGAKSGADCLCAEGYYYNAAGRCVECPEARYCTGGDTAQRRSG
jgi:hypothetical protein